MKTLSLLETRVLGTLYEKQHTVPDTYPLTLNALVSGCNQKTSRSPVMEATESEVQATLDSLKSANLVIESSGGRVARYSHNVERVLQVPSQSAAILAVLMLRGPQTPGELRTRTERMYRFESNDELELTLLELTERELVAQLARRPGERGQRYAHLLEGEPDELLEEGPPPEMLERAAPAVDGGLAERVDRLEAELAALRAELGELRDRLDA
jgi:uncharacterized protein